MTGGESRGAMRTLLLLYRRTGKERFLRPLPRAVAYLLRSRLPDGRLARFYELKTNRPLYFTKDYKLTYSDADMPTHYAFKMGCDVEQIATEYEKLKGLDSAELTRPRQSARLKLSADLVARTQKILAALDDQGRWIEVGRLRYHGRDDPTRRVIDSRTFVTNLDTLTRYPAATRP